MEMDDTVVYYMEWVKRMTDGYYLHLGALEECRRGLVDHLEGIIREKDALGAQKAKNTLASYSQVLIACREQGGDFMLRSIGSCLAELNKLLQVSEGNELPIDVFLPEANWSVECAVVGRIRHTGGHLDTRELMSLRGGYFGTMIYLIDTRPSVGELSGWPDKNSVIVSGGGGEVSEEMNYASSEGRPYINGAGRYFPDLVRLDGKVVSLHHSSPIRIEDRGVAAGIWLLPTELTHHPPIEYIDHIVTHPTIREMAYAFLVWCVDGTEAGTGICEQLKPLISPERYEKYVSQGRLIPRKDYPEGYKIKKGNEFIRALARLAAARERRNFDYALEVAKAFPCEPLVQVLTNVLSEDERKLAGG